jgi:phosphoglycerate kinase
VPEILKQQKKEVAIGYLVEKEVAALAKVVNAEARPYIAILGGAKVSDKIKVIEQLLTKTDQILIGGAMAYTFLKALGHQVGCSLVEDEQLEYAKTCYKSGKILLPVDHIVAGEIKASVGHVTKDADIWDGSAGFDIGPKTIKLYEQAILNAKTVFVNGPVGVFENPAFDGGTKAIFAALSQNKKAFIVIGGGDSAAAAKKFGYDKGQFSHISTGGGASLEIIENDGHLPGIDILNN